MGGRGGGGVVVPVEVTVSGALRRDCGGVGTGQKHGVHTRSGHQRGDAEGVGSGGQRVGYFHRARHRGLLVVLAPRDHEDKVNSSVPPRDII